MATIHPTRSRAGQLTIARKADGLEHHSFTGASVSSFNNGRAEVVPFEQDPLTRWTMAARRANGVNPVGQVPADPK
jgi:hypothetical protein